MEFFASTETEISVMSNVFRVMGVARGYLADALRQPPFDASRMCISYIPIVRAPEMQARFPARSKARTKTMTVECCPQLSYEVFLSGTRREQIAEYLNGLQGCSPMMRTLGATPEQVEAFEMLLAKAHIEVPEIVRAEAPEPSA